MLKRALLLVDRGSREPEVKEELQEMCLLAGRKAGYDHTSFCFLEVVPPFIEEGIGRCVDSGANQITIMPYFLYPGMKLKDTVKKSARICKDRNLKIAIAKPLSYHALMAELIRERVSELKREKRIDYSDSDCDVLLIGHGSSDRNAHDAFVYTADSLRPSYRRVHHCFLELDKPNIESGIASAIAEDPKVILMMPYFLHKGAHIKRDVLHDIDGALAGHDFKNAFLSRHLGVDEKLVDLILERTSEVEKRAGFKSQ
ncbi:MAG TPA: CbiX/SirB N-terminal domain-containing protein [Nitrososphaera sp.]|nr:CbiX/SirB N-terminal domain-containing protein [Nitrososphaera sp.]